MQRIAVVDDNDLLRRTLYKILKKKDYQVVAFPNGQEALDHCRINHVNLVITDMEMPVKDGLALIEDLQREKPTVQVMAISGNGEQLEIALAAGATAALKKPFDGPELLCVVERILPPMPPSEK